MKIILTPVRSDALLTVSHDDDILCINGEVFDFSVLPEGALLPRAAVACSWLASDVVRTNGVLHLTLAFPHGPGAGSAVRYPAPLTVTGQGALLFSKDEPMEDMA